MVTIQQDAGAQRRGTWTVVLTMKVGTILGATLAVPKPSTDAAKVASLAVIVLQLHMHDETVRTKLKSELLANTPSKLTPTESLTAAAKAFNFVKPANTSGWCLSGKYC